MPQQSWAGEQTARLPVQAMRIEYAADMRYEGQGYDVTVALQNAWLETWRCRCDRRGVPCCASRGLWPRQREQPRSG